MAALGSASVDRFIVFAHFGHWYISLPVFMTPVLGVLILIMVERWRDKRNPERRREREALDDDDLS
jgi:hypothetical protein